MSDTRVHFYSLDDAEELGGFELSAAVHPRVLGDSLEKKMQDTIVKGMRRLILKNRHGGDKVLREILGKKESTEGDKRLIEAFDMMFQASLRGKFIGPNIPEMVVVDGKEMSLSTLSIDLLASVHFPADSVQKVLVKHGILTGQGRNSIEERTVHISTTLSPAFVEGTQEIKSVLNFDDNMRRTVGGILERTQTILETQAPTDDDWARALLACPEDEFMRSFNFFAHGDTNFLKSREPLYRLGPAVLLRYHQVNMESYRGSHEGNDHWLSPEKLPLCSVCKHGIAGAQNFMRDAGSPLHASCLPKYLSGNRPCNMGSDMDYAQYMVNVYNALFPSKKPLKVPKVRTPRF